MFESMRCMRFALDECKSQCDKPTFLGLSLTSQVFGVYHTYEVCIRLV